MGSTTLLWKKLWHIVWRLIPEPTIQDRIMVAMDDSINPKTGKKIFGCASFHNHAAKNGQSSYPWSLVSMPLDFRSYHMEKEIEAKRINVKRKGKVIPFESKMEQAGKMLKAVQTFNRKPVLAVADSWFGNDGLWSQPERGGQGKFNLLCRLRSNITLFDFLRKTRYIAIITTDLSLSVKEMIEYYGARWKIEAGFKEIKQESGSAKSQTRNANSVLNHLSFCMMGTTMIWIYADKLEKAPDRKYKISGRAGFAFSDVRRIISEAALDPHFQSVCPVPRQRPQKSLVKMLLRMFA